MANLRIASMVGARPNFMKIAPIVHEIQRTPGIEHRLVHSGQHYDQQMSESFFDELHIPKPDVNLEVGSGSHAWQTAEVMKRFEAVVLEWKPDVVIVVGDVNSTLAAALVASKLGSCGGSCGSGAAQLRYEHAGRDQSEIDGCNFEFVVRY